MAICVSLMTASATVIQASPVQSQPNCISNQGNWFTGILTRPDIGGGASFEGASALLVPRYGHLCDYNPNNPYDYGDTDPQRNFLSGWSMNANGRGAQAYAQSGYFRGWGENTYMFTEYRGYNDPVHTRNVEYARPPLNYGGINRFWVQFVYDGGCCINGHYRLNVDSTVLAETPWNPWASNGLNASRDGIRAEFSGETHYTGSDMPGTQSVPALFQGLMLQRADDQWTTTMPTTYGAGPGGSRYGFARDSARSFKIWTFGV